MAAYFKRWALLTLVMLALVAGLAYVTDPYGLYRAYEAHERKPHAGSQGALVKPYRSLQVSPRTLILGNSRAEVGFDPADPAWPGNVRPVYNLALPGTGTRVWRRLFEHVQARRPPAMLVLGVDFMDFLLAPDAPAREPELGARLLVGPDGRENSLRWLAGLSDGAHTLASLDALGHSLDTLRRRGDSDSAHLTAMGFNPMSDYRALAAREGYFALFRQRDVENLRQYRKRPRNLFRPGARDSVAFDDLSAVLEQARMHGVKVDVVIYPYHGHLLETFRIAGLWPWFEEWKRELTARVAAHDDHARLWDFSAYHRYAREAVPKAGDLRGTVAHYWEAGHFKSALGHAMLQRMTGAGEPGFGAMLTPAMLDAHFTAIRRDGEGYRRERVDEIAALERLAR